MKKRRNFQFVLLAGIVLSLAGILLAQTAPGKSFVVNGKTAGATVREIDGHSYIDIESLARVTNGTITIEPNRIVLTIPTTNSPVVTTAAAPTPEVIQASLGISRDFARAAISELAEMREWRGAVGAMITYGLAAGTATAQDYHARVQEGLGQATVAATTDSDRNALQLLKNESDNLTAWAAQVLADRQRLNGARTVDPNSLANDPALAKITSCGRFLNTMIVSGAFADDSNCH
jgi:hypothetical protein